MLSEEHQAQDHDDDPAEMVPRAPPSSMPRAPPNSPSLGPSSDFVIWEDAPEPLSTLHTTTSSAHSALQVSGSSVDRIIDHYGHQSSSTAQSQATVCGSDPELDCYIVQNTAALVANVSVPVVRQATHLQGTTARPGTPFVYSEGAYANAEVDTPASQDAMPASPFLSSNPFPAVPPRTTSRAAETSTPTSLLDDEEDSEYDNAMIGSDICAVSRTGSEEGPSDAESKVGQLIAPPARMNSTRRRQQQRGRRSIESHNSDSLGGAMTEESDDDPFLYDQPSVFLQPSKEREVSACLHKVSGLARESTATVYSQDGTPSKTYYGSQYFVNDQTVSPGSRQLLDGIAGIQAPAHNPFDESAKRPQHRASGSVGDRFYDAKAVRSEWAMGSPDVVKVPVKTHKSKENRFARGSQNPAEAGRFQNEEMNWAALRRRDEAQAQAYRMTGDTED